MSVSPFETEKRPTVSEEVTSLHRPWSNRESVRVGPSLLNYGSPSGVVPPGPQPLSPIPGAGSLLVETLRKTYWEQSPGPSYFEVSFLSAIIVGV